MKDILIGSVVSIVLVGVFTLILDSAASMPDVYVKYSTNECVKVVNYTDEIYSCENLPSKFNHVWVN